MKESKLTEKEKSIVLVALFSMAVKYYKEWEETQDDFCRDTLFSILEVARKIDSGSRYTHDIGALATRMNK